MGSFEDVGGNYLTATNYLRSLPPFFSFCLILLLLNYGLRVNRKAYREKWKRREERGKERFRESIRTIRTTAVDWL